MFFDVVICLFLLVHVIAEKLSLERTSGVIQCSILLKAALTSRSDQVVQGLI